MGITDCESANRQSTWRDDYPWLLLLKTFRVSIGLQVLFLAGLAAVATSAGWRLSSSFLGSDSGGIAETVATDRAYLSKWPGQRTMPGLPSTMLVPESVGRPLSDALGDAPSNPVVALPIRVVLPFIRAFNRDLSWGQFFYFAAGGFWTLMVWSAAGTAIARIAVVQIGREDRIELASALRFSQNKFPSAFGATLMPILGVGILAMPVAGLGLLMRLGIGTLLAGLLWPVVIVTTAMMSMMLLGLLSGWPLVNVAIAAEGSDAFDGVSRSFAYAFQRPLRYLVYCLVAVFIGMLGWLLVWGFSEAVIGLGYWSATWGLGREQVAIIVNRGDELSGLSWAGAALIHFWVAVVRTLASGYGYSFFWCAMTGVYLLLRQAVDSTEWDEVFDDGRQGGIVYGLPPINASEATKNRAKPIASSESA